MKTKLLTLSFLILGLSIYAQDIETSVFTINLSTPSEESVKSTNGEKRLTSKSRNLIQFELVGGNPFKYRYVINNRFVDFFSDKSNNPISNIEAVLNSKPKIEGATLEEAKKESETERKNDVIEKLSTELGLKITPDLLSNIDNNKNIDVSLIENAVKKQKVKINNQKVTEIADFVKDDKNYYNYVALNSYNILQAESKVTEKPSTPEQDLKNLKDALELLMVETDALKVKIESEKIELEADEILDYDDFKNKRTEFNLVFKKLFDDFSNIKKDIVKFEEQKEDFKASEESIKNALIAINTILAKFNGAKLNNYTLPIDVNGKNIDALEITLERFTNDNPAPLDKYSYNVWIKGGLKIDVSGGVFITSLVNKEYRTENRTVNIAGTEEQHQVIFERDKGGFEYGFGSTINVSYRSAGWVNPTLAIGALFTADQQFQLLAGGGLILGKQERIILNGGVSMGRVNKISDDYKADGQTTYDLGTGAVPMSNKFAFGGFFGITYNFSKPKVQTTE